MKFEYAIVLALITLVAVVGFVSADRLPSQVPENQMITIDTLIDVTGAVSDSSSMQWVLDDQKMFTEWSFLGDGDASGYLDLDEAARESMSDNGITFTTQSNTNNNQVKIADLHIPASAENTVLSQAVLKSLAANGITGVTTYGQLAEYHLDSDSSYTGEKIYDTGSIHDSKLNPTESIMLATWTDEIRTNGGKTSLNKNIDFDSKNKVDGMNNLEVEKVLTYASTEGSHLTGAESWTLDVAGNYKKTEDTIRCVFASSSSKYFPAFCNVVKAKSELVNVNSAQISTKGALRGVAATGDVPAALSYQIAVTPDSNSGSGFADGTIKTMFGGSIMEARDNHQTPSATNSWKDSASVTGGIKNFQKTFAYESGFSYN